MSEMGEYLGQAERSEKGRIKRRLLDWGGALDLCGRKEEQLRKAERLRKEHRKYWEESDSAEAKQILEEIDRVYGRALEEIKESIAEILRGKAEMDERIGRLGMEEQMFLYMRFEKGYSFDYICMKLHMSRASIFRLQEKIFTELAEDESV